MCVRVHLYASGCVRERVGALACVFICAGLLDGLQMEEVKRTAGLFLARVELCAPLAVLALAFLVLRRATLRLRPRV